MKLIKRKLIAIKNRLIEYKNNYKSKKEVISSLLESDLNEDYITKCNNILLQHNYIDEPLNENGLKLYILFKQKYLFTGEEINTFYKKLRIKEESKTLKI